MRQLSFCKRRVLSVMVQLWLALERHQRARGSGILMGCAKFKIWTKKVFLVMIPNFNLSSVYEIIYESGTGIYQIQGNTKILLNTFKTWAEGV